MYAQKRGHFYIQLEDDIQVKENYMEVMRKVAKTSELNWFVIDFSQHGFVGKMFRAADLPAVVQFFIMFYDVKPCDWLIDHLLQTMVCRLDQGGKDCAVNKKLVKIPYKPPLFKHVGTYSSLRGQMFIKTADGGSRKVSMGTNTLHW